MFFLFSLIAVFAVLRLFTSVWLKIWLDKGDGLERIGRNNATLYNISLTEEDMKSNISDNPGNSNSKIT